MKIKITVSLLLFLVFMHPVTRAQRADTVSEKKRYCIKTNPYTLMDGEARILTEKYMNEHNSLELITSYYMNYSLFEMYHNKRLFSRRSGFKTGIGYRHYYGSKKAYSQVLVFYKFLYYKNAPDDTHSINTLFLSEQSWQKQLNERSDYTRNMVAAQGLIGKLSPRGKHVMVDVYIGIGIRYYKGAPAAAFPDLYFPTVHFGVNIGYHN